MKEHIENSILTLLKSDETVTPEMFEALKRMMHQPVQRRKLIPAKKAQEILGVSRPTLREYVKRGLLEQVSYSSRMVRFDEEQVGRLACHGATGCESWRVLDGTGFGSR